MLSRNLNFVFENVCDETQRNLLSLIPDCQVCISEMAEVTDTEASIQNVR
jgi:hypothetical protein